MTTPRATTSIERRGLTLTRPRRKNQYTSRVQHWSIADREAHEKMGFHQGWVTCAEQLAALVE